MDAQLVAFEKSKIILFNVAVLAKLLLICTLFGLGGVAFVNISRAPNRLTKRLAGLYVSECRTRPSLRAETGVVVHALVMFVRTGVACSLIRAAAKLECAETGVAVAIFNYLYFF